MIFEYGCCYGDFLFLQVGQTLFTKWKQKKDEMRWKMRFGMKIKIAKQLKSIKSFLKSQFVQVGIFQVFQNVNLKIFKIFLNLIEF